MHNTDISPHLGSAARELPSFNKRVLSTILRLINTALFICHYSRRTFERKAVFSSNTCDVY